MVVLVLNCFYLAADYNPVGLQYATTVSISRPGRQRHFYTDNQLELLHAEFAAEPFPCRESRNRIALQLGVSEKSVMVGFKNRNISPYSRLPK